MAENSKNLLAFRGGDGGFISNRYAIWQSGLYNGEKQEEPNLWAVKAGVRVSIAALKTQSLHGNAVFRKLVDFLWKIQKQEEEKEGVWMQQKRQQFSQFGIEPAYWNQIEKAIGNKEYGLAYTLMTQANKDIKELQRELGKNGQSMSRLNKFWKAQFEHYFVDRLDHALQQKEMGNLNANLSIDEILEDWIQSLISDSSVSVSSMDYIKTTIQTGLVSLFNNQGIHITSKDNLLNADFKQFVGAKRVHKKKSNGKRSETLNGLLTRVENTIAKGLQRGLSAEMLALGETGRGGAVSISTGNIKKAITNELSGKNSKVYQKGDVISIEAYNTQINLSDYAESFYESLWDGGEAGLSNLERYLQEIINDTNDIYIVEVNTKGYQSLRDLEIQKSGNFYARMNNLYKMRNQFPAKSIEQLIFLLNNTMDDCVASHHIDTLGDYFSAVFAAWMWDDYTEIFKEMNQTGVKRIRIFNSGGVYFSASQMMKRTLEDLLMRADSSSFVYATITPPSFDANSMYASLKKDYSVEGVPGGQSRQNILAQRWDAMRDRVMREGEISLYIRQKQLDELFGKLASFM